MSQQSQAHPLILIVEDETSIASFGAMYLKKAGYENLVNLGTVENASRVLNRPLVK